MTFEERLDRLLDHQEGVSKSIDRLTERQEAQSKSIDRLTERHEALAESVQLLHAETMATSADLRLLVNTVNLLAVKVDALTASVADHDKRIDDLEQR